ncbi:RagB/SusD family nutrient uptake outer membrane protein [Salisaeta longa]|uniref:RagB/SusD family nutrient uptake outer membrane protein n=1 Tax=Salisaeta longa TaxID=503170 RepID=UPI0003B651FB|nr:RagB/SusD family nutrient uptake outer membrane protein [Salisaeta longa]
MMFRSTHTLYRALFVAAFVALFTGLTACDNVGVQPKSSATASTVFTQDGAFKQFLAKLYGSFNVTGQQGPAGSGDIGGIDEGFSQYMRLYWQMQELTTDEAIIAWNDNGIRELHNHSWDAANQFSRAMYDRIFFTISQSNEFLRQSTDAKLEQYGVSANRQQVIQQYRAEARFLRALAYWHGIDLFGNIPLVTEDFTRGSEAPQQSTRAEIFAFVESELKAITDSEGEENLPAVGQAEYGRADAAAAYMVLAKLYQNAPVYIGENRSADVIEYTTRIIDANAYSLETEATAQFSAYHRLFLADNHTANGIIFAIPQDGNRTQHYGGTTFLCHAPVGGSMNPAAYGLDFGWAGLRTTAPVVDRYSGTDDRAIFFTQGQSKEIDDIGTFTDGYAVPKYQNVTSTGAEGKNATFPDTDYPMFRLADAYLMYAEAVLRGGGGSQQRALELVNDLRERAGLGRDVTATELDLQFILDERSRELMWEGHRRIDLIRFGQYTTDAYLWPWKGGVKEGQATQDHLRLFPLPATELRANPNLEQNPGYS